MVLILLLLTSAARAEDRKTLRAQPLQGAEIEIDGRLDEPAWSRAEVGDHFVERSPVPGAPAPVRHEVRVLYDEDAVYVGVSMELAPDEVPRALELTRDDDAIFEDDAVSLKFDVRTDRRTTVGFVINPAGTQFDYLALENGSDFRPEYDAVWEGESTVDLDERRWITEFRIPVAALGLPSGETDRIVGLNVTRDHNARIATYDWAPIPPEFGPMSALYYGDLVGLDDIGGGAPLSLIPYVLGSYENADGHDLDASAGGDIRLRVGQDVWTELTVLPDFAQTDLDDPVINFDRFPLFFPERRAFFLTGLQVFDFGARAFSQVFFSRRIGLDGDGNFVPVWGGLKTYGRAGPLQFGLFEVLTGDSADQPASNWTVLRLRNNFGETGHLGLIGTLQGSLPVGEDGAPFQANYAGGVDGSVRLLDRRLELSGFWSGSSNTDADERGSSGQARIAYRGEILQPSVTVVWITEDFDPRIGFVARSDILQTHVEMIYIHRFDEHSPLAQIFASIAGRDQRSIRTGDNIGKRFFSYLSFLSKTGWSIGAWWEPGEDVVAEAFDVLGDQPVEAGRYFGHLAGVSFNSSGKRNPNGSLLYSVNTGFFGGVIHKVGLAGRARLGPHFAVAANADLGFAKRPDFDWRTTVSGRAAITIAPTTTLSAELIAQVNNVDDVANGFVRIRWRYLPGSDIFLVYREQLDIADRIASARRDLTLKILYRFDTVL